MIRSRPRFPRWPFAVTVLSLASLLAMAALATPACAQSPFRVAHIVEKGGQPQVTISGRVFNDARADAIDVYVTAEALDAGGKVIASGVSYVGSVASGSSTAFVIKVPTTRAAANFRVIVTSHRFGFSNQS